MKYILQSQLLNSFRSQRPRGFYSVLLGHTGVDLNYHFQDLPSPVTGVIEKITKQAEMGSCIYLKDLENGNIHVFAHMDSIKPKQGDRVERGQMLGRTGNSGRKTTAPHLHYEIITFNRPVSLVERLKVRKLNGYVGWNLDPIKYLRELYGKYRLDIKGNPIK